MAPLLLAIGAVQLAQGWAGVPAAVVLTGAALVPYGAVRLGARLRVSPVVTAPGLVVAALVALWRVGPPGAAPFDALRDAVPRLLTAARPAPATPELLAPGVLLAVLVGVFVGVRAVRPGGGRFAPVAGAVVLYLAGALLTAGRADRYGLVAAVLVGCAVLGWTLRDGAPRDGAPRRWSGPGVAAVAVLAVVLPSAGAFEPRELVSPPPRSLTEPNPLPRLAAYAEQGGTELFRYTGDGTAPVHLVALDEFTGASWRAAARYRPIGAVAATVLPGADRRTDTVTDVTIAALTGPWLPAPGRPTAVSLDGALVDAESGSLVHPDGLRPGLRYEVRSQVDTPADTDLVVAGVPNAARYLAVPRLPYLFAEYGQRILRGASTPFEQAVLIENAVREGRRLDPAAPAGSSYARLETFLFGPPGAQVGTSEQFAAAFAVLARNAGLPTRVMAGFRPGTRTADGSWVVRGRDALAWPEVYFAGQGWVAFDPSRSARDAAGPAGSARQGVLERVGQNQPPPSQPPPKVLAPSPAAVTAPVAGRRRTPVPLAPAAGTAVAVVLAVLVAGRTVRRLRHRRAGPRGAWSEVLDLLVLLGRRPPGWRTAGWIADDLATAVPAAAETIHHLAYAADRATFAPRGTPVVGSWAELRRVRRAVRRTVPWYRRIAWPVDPRPLLRR